MTAWGNQMPWVYFLEECTRMLIYMAPSLPWINESIYIDRDGLSVEG